MSKIRQYGRRIFSRNVVVSLVIFGNVWIFYKHLWFISYAHPSFIFLHLPVFPIAHNFPSLALYPHGATKPFVFAFPYAIIYDI